MARYRVTIDKDACDGIFACMMRDDRIAESDDMLATYDAGEVSEDESVVVAEFDDDRIDDAKQAAAACPPNAITVEEL
ncbi:ferredoxin [Haloarculaceae archaeon H-GB2-1]|nr:ferredoxin [Haloarculaceae archaeon H-GB1-1]MEA5386155.1 ferredoxin [Haloarculaceae archaeon H-GB11]MEA5407661.1 ferredoxin [Haloarculaceae archaeon H-GB2-1]